MSLDTFTEEAAVPGEPTLQAVGDALLLTDSDMAAVGIDACRKGWVAVVLSDDGDVSAHFLTEVAAIGDAVPEASSIAIDIPIGLPKSGPREADLVARVELQHRRTSVFLVPSRAVLEARDHASATALSRTQTGSGISQQAFALRSKIFEVEAWLPIAPCPVWEVHPELSYCEMLGEPASAP